MTAVVTPDAFDLFAGPGGWDVALRWLGLEALGLEMDAAACQTRRAAGFPTVEGDLTQHRDLIGLSEHVPGLIGSPPCQTFSLAGNGAGHRALDDVLDGIRRLVFGEPLPVWDDERTGLVLEPLRWVLDAYRSGHPFRWVALEQVPPVLPVWQRMAEVLGVLGYHTWAGYVHAEQYGVPQTRKRAVLLASLDRDVHLPTPTHSKYHPRSPERLDDGVLPWVSMAEALGWGMTERPSMTVTGGGAATGGAEPFGNAARQGMVREQEAGRWRRTASARQANDVRWEQREPVTADRLWVPVALQGNQKTGGSGIYQQRGVESPAQTITTQTGSFRWLADDAVNNQSGSAYDVAEQVAQPASTVTGRDLVPFRGANANRFNGSTKSRNDGVRVTVAEAACLQTFPADHPWQGSKSKQYQQIGNAFPCILALHCLAEVLGVPAERKV